MSIVEISHIPTSQREGTHEGIQIMKAIPE